MMKKIISYIILMISACTGAPAQVDVLEFPPGHPSFANQPPAIQQLQTFPGARYKNNHTLLPNYNWADPLYAGGYKQPGVADATSYQNAADIQYELAKNFNYMINLYWGGGDANTKFVQVANANPAFKTSITTLRAQTGGCQGSCCLWCGCLASDKYLQDSQGRYLGWEGEVISYKGTPRPTSSANEWLPDATNAKNYVQSSLSILNRNVNMVNEDAEVYPRINNYGMDADQVVKSARIASGLSHQLYLADRIRIWDNAYRDQIMSLSKCGGAKYTQYQTDGHRTYQFLWEKMKYVNSPINGQYYSTADFYPRWANNWKDWISAWHGLKWITQSRHYEIADGDKLFSPFIGAGWDANPETDVRPAQWLGLLKLLGIYGAEFYYTGYFNEGGNYNPPNPPPNDPKGYAWQYVIPGYSQAISSHYETILRQGTLMAGEMTDNSNTDEVGTPKPIPYYQFYTGKTNYVVAARKLGTKYVISGTIQNSSNQIGSAPLTDVATITLDGQQMTFKIRRHGSTYIYDSQAKTFYQLDGWHEYAHPYRWSSDIEMEAEVNDVTTGTIKSTYTAPDFVNFKTVLALSINQNANYSFMSRAALNTLFVKASGSGNLETTIDGVVRNMAINGNGWYKLSVPVAAGNHALWLTALSNLEIDSISVTSNPNKYPITITPPACPVPQGLYHAGVYKKGFYIYWNRISEADSGYVVYVKDLTTGTNLPPYTKPQRDTPTMQRVIGNLISKHQYEAYIVTRCKDAVSQPSQKITVTTK